MTDADAPSRSRNPLDPIIVGIVVLACLLFVWAVFEAGHASVLCDPPPAKLPDGGICDAEGRPLINPYLPLIVTPLAATLATYFGAALGIANVQALDTPYTHIIIKTCGSSLAGVIVGVLALSLGVKPQKALGPGHPIPPSNIVPHAG